MTIDQFCAFLVDQDTSYVETALGFLWWFDRFERGRELSPGELAKLMKTHSIGNPNVTTLGKALKKSRMALGSNGRYKLRASARAELDVRFGNVGQPVDSSPVSPTVDAPDRMLQDIGNRAKQASVANRLGRPTVFVGSSVEGLEAATCLMQHLEYECEVTVWNDDVVALSKSTLEGLVEKAPTFDFAILVLTPDDKLEKRGIAKAAPRDNVLFELGLFMGALGRHRVFIVTARDIDLGIPTDLLGITPAKYEAIRQDKNVVAALQVPAAKILREIKATGRRV